MQVLQVWVYHTDNIKSPSKRLLTFYFSKRKRRHKVCLFSSVTHYLLVRSDVASGQASWERNVCVLVGVHILQTNFSLLIDSVSVCGQGRVTLHFTLIHNSQRLMGLAPAVAFSVNSHTRTHARTHAHTHTHTHTHTFSRPIQLTLCLYSSLSLCVCVILTSIY